MDKITTTFLAIIISYSVVLTVGETQTNQRALLYRNQNQLGEYVVLNQTYGPDLSQYSIASTCVTGTWIFYADKMYSGGGKSVMEYVFGVNNFCSNLKWLGVGGASRVQSARFVGSPVDYRSDTLTLFRNTNFQGDEEYTFTDLQSLSLDVRSLVITGSSPWTLYDSLNFNGISICLFPPASNNFEPYFLPDTMTKDIPHGTIKSVKKGCYGKKN